MERGWFRKHCIPFEGSQRASQTNLAPPLSRSSCHSYIHDGTQAPGASRCRGFFYLRELPVWDLVAPRERFLLFDRMRVLALLRRPFLDEPG